MLTLLTNIFHRKPDGHSKAPIPHRLNAVRQYPSGFFSSHFSPVGSQKLREVTPKTLPRIDAGAEPAPGKDCVYVAQ
jgi:hypothetical protein